ncbi:MBOAT, membrane-bound O-acyltransferase family-domain-containing protein [Hyaloraphidium curvatum]|nr:MBOAT, membrane-bound O-acyltransferase family-domain-containing protein [Hyaloraphidium curvatum]
MAKIVTDVPPPGDAAFAPGARPGTSGRKRPLFVARTSLLDSDNLGHLWGFVNLFWLAVAFYAVRTAYTEGISWGLLGDLGVNVGKLFAADFAMILSLFPCVPLEIAVAKGWVSRRVGTYIGWAYSLAFFVAWTSFLWSESWTFFQTGCLALHSLTMLMKLHSYCAVNTELATKTARLRALKRTLVERQKRTANGKGASENGTHADSDVTAALELEITDLEEELHPPGVAPYPKNLTFSNFIDFLRIPALVYQLSYPRTDKIRWSYVGEKVLGFAGCFVVLYVTIVTWIMPTLKDPNALPLMEMIGRLLFPMLICYILIFLMVWEYLTNAFAELSFFADRAFYEDWWNATDFAFWSRSWNRPVYLFLLTHVHGASRRTGMGRESAALFTFFLSSVLHEVVLTLVTKRFRPVLFFFQMSQVPLIRIGSAPFLKKNARLTNIFWWCGMMLGFPVIGILYVRDFTLSRA